MASNPKILDELIKETYSIMLLDVKATVEDYQKRCVGVMQIIRM